MNLYNKGEFVEKTSMQYYDEEADQWLADRYIVGTCPHCGNDHAYGDQCESCGTSLNATDLINPHSAITGNVPVLRETKHWYMPLDKWEPKLRHWILDEHKEWKPNVYGQCKSWLDQHLQPRAVTRDLKWGIPVPIKGAEGKVLYVWFDAPIGYISNTKELLPNTWEKYWKDKDTRIIHFIGKDNIVFHCLIFPAMLMADGSYQLPENVPANEFLNLEGKKISTSRNWAVWLNEYLEEFPGKQDVLRYVLCANAPETKDNDFTWKDFQARNNNELVAIFGNFVNRALVLTQKYFKGVIPAAHELTDYDKQTLAEFSDVKDKLGENIETFHFRAALNEAMNLARIGNKYLADTEPWKVAKTGDTERVETILNIALQLCANLAIAFEPFCPFNADNLLAYNRTGGFMVFSVPNPYETPVATTKAMAKLTVTGSYSSITAAAAPEQALRVYPNPATDVVNVEASEPITDIIVFSLSGARISTETSISGNTATVSVGNLAAGAYIMKVNNRAAQFVKK